MITVITNELYQSNIQQYKRKYHKKIHNFFFKEKVRGPASHLKCLLGGLKKLNIEFNLNPSIENIHSIVFVPNNPYALEQVVELKKEGIIEIIIAGPNVAVFPQDFKIIVSKEIDYYLQTNIYYKNLWMELEPKLIGKIVLYPVGVDEERWRPSSNHKDKILLYIKKTPDIGINKLNEKLLSINEDYLENKKIEYIKMTYGTHSQEEYYQNLDISKLLIIFGGLEGSPTAHVEAWSMNVPSCIKLYNSLFLNKKILYGSSSPYLSDYTGSFFSDMEQLMDLINERMLNCDSYSPREWVEKYMTDKICTETMLREVNILSS